MTLTDQDMTIWAQIQHLRKVKKEIDLMIQSLHSLLPDRNPMEHRPVYVLNPKTGKREEVQMNPHGRSVSGRRSKPMKSKGRGVQKK
jgi:hypothetical protein